MIRLTHFVAIDMKTRLFITDIRKISLTESVSFLPKGRSVFKDAAELTINCVALQAACL